MPESISLGEALEQSAETPTEATPISAQDEQTPVTDQSATDSSLIENESVEAKPEETPTEQPKEGEQPTKAELDFKALREQKTTLETELSGIRENLNQFGGESHLRIMAPMLQKAAEIPPAGEAEKWSGEMWQAVQQSFVPEQVTALRSLAAWDFLNDPASATIIAQDLYGEKMTPELLREFAAAYERDPSVVDLFRPEETPEARAVREKYEADNQAQEAKNKEVAAQLQRIEDERNDGFFKQTMTQTLQIGLAPRAEIKKQFGLEFQKNDRDTPEVAAFNELASEVYDDLVGFRLARDDEMNRLSAVAESWAKQKDPQHRQKAMDLAQAIKERANIVCSKVATRLSNARTLLSPELSDQAKARNLKDLPAQVLGSGAGATSASGIDYSKMPDPINDPRGYAAWVAKQFTEQNAQQRTPAILQAG